MACISGKDCFKWIKKLCSVLTYNESKSIWMSLWQIEVCLYSAPIAESFPWYSLVPSQSFYSICSSVLSSLPCCRYKLTINSFDEIKLSSFNPTSIIRPFQFQCYQCNLNFTWKVLADLFNSFISLKDSFGTHNYSSSLSTCLLAPIKVHHFCNHLGRISYRAFIC